jgi:hypothetical protein
MRSGPRGRVGVSGLGCVPGDFAASPASDMKMAEVFYRSLDRGASNHVIGGQFGSAFRAFHGFVSTAELIARARFVAFPGGTGGAIVIIHCIARAIQSFADGEDLCGLFALGAWTMRPQDSLCLPRIHLAA